ncbi:hypothetical protein [Agrobacterium rosae]|uniref:Uncharacterized protein n=1 Tax=Agrobacterium rosae TaxID=1972867 RepID=A0A1R3U669_9HYPH|nr:hypothetical protein [Agrobacterium rosae]SCX35866.1 hypothetical protein DSM25559_5190 [Agrobacterium rosae]
MIGGQLELLLTCVAYFAMLTAGHATTCSTDPIDYNAPGLSPGTLLQKVEAIFLTYRSIVLSTDELAILWIDPADCNAPDLDAQEAQVEKIVNRQVMLRAAVENYRLISAFRYPEVVATRKLKEVFPTLTLRGDKIGKNVEVLLVKVADFSASDAIERRARAAAIVGRPVELQLSAF